MTDMADPKVDVTRQQVRLRGRSYVAFVFAPVVPIVDWLSEMDATLATSPGFFVGKPAGRDLSGVDLRHGAMAHLVSHLGQRQILLLAIVGVAASRLATNKAP